jgi:hypothetical protein
VPSVTAARARHPRLGRVVHVQKGKDGRVALLSTWDPGTDGPPTIIALKGGATGSQVNTYGVSSDGTTVAVCAGEPYSSGVRCEVSLHSTTDGRLITFLPVEEAEGYWQYQRLELSHDGAYLAGLWSDGLSSVPGRIDVYRMADGKRIHRTPDIEGNASRVSALLSVKPSVFVFSPDGKFLFYERHANRGRCRLMKVDLATGIETAE